MAGTVGVALPNGVPVPPLLEQMDMNVREIAPPSHPGQEGNGMSQKGGSTGRHTMGEIKPSQGNCPSPNQGKGSPSFSQLVFFCLHGNGLV